MSLLGHHTTNMSSQASKSTSHKATSQNVDSHNYRMEYLLKKAYAVHRNKVKELEEQLGAAKSSKKLENSPTICIQCQVLKTSLDELRKEFASQLDEKNKHIEDLKSELENLRLVKREIVPNELVLESKKPWKRKRGVFNWGQDTNVNESDSSSLKLLTSRSSNSNSETPPNNILVPETLIDMPLVSDGNNMNNEENMIVLETLQDEMENSIKAEIRSESPQIKFELNRVEDSLDDFRPMEINNNRVKSQIDVKVNEFKSKISPFKSKTKLEYFASPRKRYRRPKFKQTTLTQNLGRLFEIPEIEVAKNKDRTRKMDSKNVEILVESPVKEFKKEQQEVSNTPEGKANFVDDWPEHLKRDSFHHEQLQRLENSSNLDETYVPSPYLVVANAVGGESVSVEVIDRMPSTPPQLLTQSDATPSPDLLFQMSEFECLTNDSYTACSEDMLKQSSFKTISHVQTTKHEAELSGITNKPPETDDFDKVPKKKSPQFKYKRDTVRRQDERRRLDGHECRECEAYFKAMDLTDKEKQERLKFCSRHRDVHIAPKTPDHFWSIEFPTTQECKDRGILDSTQNKPLQSRRRQRQ